MEKKTKKSGWELSGVDNGLIGKEECVSHDWDLERERCERPEKKENNRD